MTRTSGTPSRVLSRGRDRFKYLPGTVGGASFEAPTRRPRAIDDFGCKTRRTRPDLTNAPPKIRDAGYRVAARLSAAHQRGAGTPHRGA